jgi:hypothetical protein
MCLSGFSGQGCDSTQVRIPMMIEDAVNDAGIAFDTQVPEAVL